MGSSSGRKHAGGIHGPSLTREAPMRHAATRMTTTALVALVLLTPAASRATTASWTVVSSVSPSKDNNTLYGVAALSSTDVWAVGDLNTGVIPTVTGRRTLVEHNVGAGFQVVPSPNPTWAGLDLASLPGVAAVSSTDVWAGGHADDFASVYSNSLFGPCE